MKQPAMSAKSVASTNSRVTHSRFQSLVDDPLRRCTLFVILGFLLFVGAGIATVIVHNRAIMIACGALNGIIFIVLLFYIGILLLTNRRNTLRYTPNLGNTIATCLLTIALCTLIYPFSWDPALNTQTLHEQVQDMATFQPPALAWITINDRHDAARLLDSPSPKGFISDIAGGFDETVTDCRTQSQEQILGFHYCRCSEMFTSLEWAPLAGHSDGMTYRSFLPGPEILFNSTNATLVLQVFSNHDTSANPLGWPLPGPMLMLMAYDPSIPVLEAFLSGLASITQIPVLGSTMVVVRPFYRVGWNREPYYYYAMSTTSIPSQNDVCDVAVNDPTKYCYTTTLVRFADMTRDVMTREQELSPGDVFAQVGGYFALVQLLCWIVSGMALR